MTQILRTRPGALVVNPTVVTGEFTKIHDQYAAEHLVGVAATAVRTSPVCRPGPHGRTSACSPSRWRPRCGSPKPNDVHAFTEELTAAVGQVVQRYDSADGRPYRMVALGHPAPAVTQGESDE